MNAALVNTVNELKKQLATVEEKIDRLSAKLDMMLLEDISNRVSQLPTRDEWQSIVDKASKKGL